MQVLLENISWMILNVILALIPIVFGILAYKSKNILLKILFGIIWFFFLPNTIYLMTDIMHFFIDVKRVSGVYLMVDLLLYFVLIVLGVVTFIMAVDPFERILFKNKSKNKIRENMPIIYILNFFVGFGVVLGRVHRLNSWDVFINTDEVIYYSLETFRSLELMILALAFAVLSQVVYIKFRNIVPRVSY